MSYNISVDEIKRKIRGGLFKKCVMPRKRKFGNFF